MPDLVPAVQSILAERARIDPSDAMLVAITGIDASGKGYLANQLAAELQRSPYHAVVINADGWLHLPGERFDPRNPGEHFYEHGFRFDAMFEQMIWPLQRNRSLSLVMDYTEETATQYRKQSFDFENVDIILLEGIFLLKRAFQERYDRSFWVDCTFETALERAILRRQEGLPPEETINAFRTIYFPAQEIHLARDHPRESASAILVNDPRLDT